MRVSSNRRTRPHWRLCCGFYPFAIFLISSSLRILIFLTFVSIRPSDTKAESVRMQLLVVILEMLARSSRLRLQSSVTPSLASPYESCRNRSASARRARMCFWVRLTVRSSDFPISTLRFLMKLYPMLLLFCSRFSWTGSG